MSDKKWVLWEDEEVSLQVAFNPAIPRSEGFHLVLLQKKGAPAPWTDLALYSRMSIVAAQAAGSIMVCALADWVNIHYDGNIGAAKGKPSLHIHIFGRYKTGKKWGGPLDLPSGEGPYGNEPLGEAEIALLRKHLRDYTI